MSVALENSTTAPILSPSKQYGYEVQFHHLYHPYDYSSSHYWETTCRRSYHDCFLRQRNKLSSIESNIRRHDSRHAYFFFVHQIQKRVHIFWLLLSMNTHGGYTSWSKHSWKKKRFEQNMSKWNVCMYGIKISGSTTLPMNGWKFVMMNTVPYWLTFSIHLREAQKNVRC